MTAAMASATATSTTSSTLPASLLPSVPENLPLVRVAFDYEYDYKTRKISVKQGERLHLLQKTNQHWWKCMRPGVNKAFFVPAQYVIVLQDPEESKQNDSRHHGTKKSDLKKSSSSVDSSGGNSSEVVTPSSKSKKSIFSTFERLKESKSSKPEVPSKSRSSISSRNEGSRASHRVVTKEKSHRNHHHHHHSERNSGSSLRLKNWSASLEELSKQIVFPGLTSESVVDLTSLSTTTNSFKPISAKQASSDNHHALSSHQATNECSASGRHGSCSSSESCDNKFHAINKCLSFRNPTFAANNNNDDEEKRRSLTNGDDESKSCKEQRTESLASQTDSSSFSKADNEEMKSKDSSDGSLDGGMMKDCSNIPVPRGPPRRLLADNWAEYFSSEKGRCFYYNSEEKKSSWKPPRSSSNRRSDECLATAGRSGASTISSSIENSLDNLYEKISSSSPGMNSNRSHNGSSTRLAKPDILQDQIPSSVGSSRKSVVASSEEINSPDKSHDNSGNSGRHGSCSSVFDSQENLDQSYPYQEDSASFANLAPSIPIPEGWEECWDESMQLYYYVNKVSGAKWFTSTDPQGKIYFYEENSSQSSWFLPEIQTVPSNADGETQEISIKVPKDSKEQTDGTTNSALATSSEEVLNFGTVKKRHSAGDAIDRGAKSKSLFLPDYRDPYSRFSSTNSLPRNYTSIWHGGQVNSIIKDGLLNRTKITEGGKKVRKNWGTVYAVLTDSHLSLFKDHKAFSALKSELEIELNGSWVEQTEEKSSRKNVFQLNTRYDLQMLFQSEDKNIAEEWFGALKEKSYQPMDLPMKLKSTTDCGDSDTIGEGKLSSRLYRNKSTKIKITSTDDMGADRKKITANLKKFFSRRPPRESLVKKGIFKDEPVFGCSLDKLCNLEKTTIPRFVEECILAIEQKEENLKTDGIYRASGNLSQVQRIRLQVDQNRYQCLYQEEDVHVLAGSLKLFFREMREPLISYDLFEKSFEAINSSGGKKDRISKFRDIIKNLPNCNKATLSVLLRHLLKIAEYAEYNRMRIPNLAIVFGPTLMWPAIESKNMALDLMQQNYVIEALLTEYESIFK